MLLGKRQRPPMKRTTSMTEFTLDLNHTTTVDQNPNNNLNNSPTSNDVVMADPRFSSVPVGPKINRRYSVDFNQTSHFLKACHLCKRRLIAGRDIFMYRGDSAFCSLECRQQQMNQDEKKDKCSISSNKHNPFVATTSTNASETPVGAM